MFAALLPDHDLIHPPPPTDASIPDPAPKIDYSLFDHPKFKDGYLNVQNDIAMGKYEPEYLAKGELARQRRMKGEFDAWKEKEFESTWGEKQRVDWSAVAADSAKVKLEDMVKHGVFRVGDVFVLRRSFAGGLCVKKEAKVSQIPTKTTITPRC